MHICLLSITYPPVSTEGIARQRQILATELVRAGHNVHVITCGPQAETYVEAGVWVHRINVARTNQFSVNHPGLDVLLSYSQALYEEFIRLLSEHPCDIVDIPLWSAPGIVTLQHYDGPSVLWLQTSTAQLLALKSQPPSAEEHVLIHLEARCLQRASGLLGDSHDVLAAVQRIYHLDQATPTGIAHLGLPPWRGSLPIRHNQTRVEALVVGRLERRKGTHLLFEVLPALLAQHPELTVRFVGSDNSAFDGWQQQQQSDYPSFFHARYPELAPQVIFEGYVEEQRLEQCYGNADMLLVPSLYESFGLIYLEAMRVELPVITFAVGGALEIFEQTEINGALLVPPDATTLFGDAISQLVAQPTLRKELGKRGRARFETTFRADQMASATVACYERIIAHYPTTRPVPAAQTVFQVMEALDVGDAVSNITRRNAAILAELGHSPVILARHTHPDVHSETQLIEYALKHQNCGLIFHYWGYNTSTWILKAIRGPKALYYHNITPAHYFPIDAPAFHNTVKGYEQIKDIADHFDLLVGDSRYNIEELRRFVSQPRPSIHLYPIIDIEEIRAARTNEALFQELRNAGYINIVFIGRIARNKRQDNIIRLFEHYYSEINRHARLWLVGSDHGDPTYRSELEQLRVASKARDHIFFTGKVVEDDVQAYYRAADVFVSASEHRRFWHASDTSDGMRCTSASTSRLGSH